MANISCDEGGYEDSRYHDHLVGSYCVKDLDRYYEALPGLYHLRRDVDARYLYVQYAAMIEPASAVLRHLQQRGVIDDLYLIDEPSIATVKINCVETYTTGRYCGRLVGSFCVKDIKSYHEALPGLSYLRQYLGERYLYVESMPMVEPAKTVLRHLQQQGVIYHLSLIGEDKQLEASNIVTKINCNVRNHRSLYPRDYLVGSYTLRDFEIYHKVLPRLYQSQGVLGTKYLYVESMSMMESAKTLLCDLQRQGGIEDLYLIGEDAQADVLVQVIDNTVSMNPVKQDRCDSCWRLIVGPHNCEGRAVNAPLKSTEEEYQTAIMQNIRENLLALNIKRPSVQGNCWSCGILRSESCAIPCLHALFCRPCLREYKATAFGKICPDCLADVETYEMWEADGPSYTLKADPIGDSSDDEDIAEAINRVAGAATYNEKDEYVEEGDFELFDAYEDD